MPTITTSVPSWQSDIDQVIPTGPHKEALCSRLSVVSSLLLNQPDVFDNVIKSVIRLLQLGIPCDYILRIVETRQPLYLHAQPAEAGLLQELEDYLSKLGDWMSDKRWLGLFVSIESPSEAANFFSCLRDAQFSSENIDSLLPLINAWFVTSQNDSRYSVIRFPASQWSLWMKGMHLYTQLPKLSQDIVLPWVRQCMQQQACPKKMMLMLSLLKDRSVNSRSLLLVKWWKHGFSSNASPETLSVLLDQMVELDTLEKEPTTELFSLMLQSAMTQHVDDVAILRARACVNALKGLDKPLQTMCCASFSESKPWFNETTLEPFYRAIPLLSGKVAQAFDGDLRQVFELAINTADVELLFTLLERINDQINANLNKPISCKTVIQLIGKNSDPIAHLQAIDQFLTTFYAMDPSKQQSALGHLKDTDFFETTRLAYVSRMLEAQALVDQLSQDQSGRSFDALLNFDDASQKIPRQTVLQAIHHGYVEVNTATRENWWSRYFNALSAWIMKPVNKTASKLDHAHHVSAVKSLQRMAMGVQEIKIIARQTPVTQSAPISDTLITSIKAYESSYSASWWKSRDRQKSANQLFELAKVQSSPVTYSAVMKEISDVMQDIVKSDQAHTHRNAKGYSRLYDIALQLLVTTASEALQHDQACTPEYVDQLNSILDAHAISCKDLDLDLPAFQHLQDSIGSLRAR